MEDRAEHTNAGVATQTKEERATHKEQKKERTAGEAEAAVI